MSKNNLIHPASFNSQGREKYLGVLSKLFNEDNELRLFHDQENYLQRRSEIIEQCNKDINNILFDSRYIQKEYNDCTIEQDKLFTNKYDLLNHVYSNIDNTLPAESIIFNWGFWDWLSAFYFKNFIRKIDTANSIITLEWFICAKSYLKNGPSSMCNSDILPESNHTLKRHVIQHHYIYFSKFIKITDTDFQDTLRQFYSTPCNSFGDQYEQLYVSGTERLNPQMLRFIQKFQKHINKIDSPRSPRNVFLLQLDMMNEYHIEKLSYNHYFEMLDNICSFIEKK